MRGYVNGRGGGEGAVYQNGEEAFVSIAKVLKYAVARGRANGPEIRENAK